MCMRKAICHCEEHAKRATKQSPQCFERHLHGCAAVQAQSRAVQVLLCSARNDNEEARNV
jgi:hypothetical protein